MSLFKTPPFIVIHNAPRPQKSFIQRQDSNVSNPASLNLLSSYNRKEKSLEELSRKFLQMFLYSSETYISLDKITDFLGVERRRIYDIINILESLNLVTRKGKNNYRWNGFHRVYETIHSFEGVDINHIKGISNTSLPIKREKSLKLLSIGFLGLFLRWKQTMSLEEAAKSLSDPVKTEDHKIKTKIRRLYDIANVFKSLGLIRKTMLGNKKPAFSWVGITGLDEFVESNNKEKQENEDEQLQKQESNKKSQNFDRAFLMKCLITLLENKTPPSIVQNLFEQTANNQNGLFTSKLTQNLFNQMESSSQKGLHNQEPSNYVEQPLQIQNNFFTPTIKRTLTIIHPKTDETQTPSSLEHSQLRREVSKEFEGFTIRDCSNSNGLKRKPLMTLSQGLDISRKSSFKKIKRCEDPENKENLAPVNC